MTAYPTDEFVKWSSPQKPYIFTCSVLTVVTLSGVLHRCFVVHRRQVVIAGARQRMYQSRSLTAHLTPGRSH